MVGLILFVGTYPFNHDRYIATVHTGMCICFNALSAILFGRFLYRIWMGRMDADARARFLVGIILLAVFHVVFSIMNWGSWLFLGLSAMAFVILTVFHVKEKMQ